MSFSWRLAKLQESGSIGRRALIGALLMGGSAAWWKYLDSKLTAPFIIRSLMGPLGSKKAFIGTWAVHHGYHAAFKQLHMMASLDLPVAAGQMPKVYKTKTGRPYMRTGAGSPVGVSGDEDGRIFFFDRAGNLYYDTGDKRLGFYIVSYTQPTY